MDVKRLTITDKKDIDQKNYARRLNALPLLVVKVRTCMQCKRSFESVGERYCGCRGTDHRHLPSLGGRDIL